MRRFFLFSFFVLYAIGIHAQDYRYVGTWKWHYDSPYDDETEGPHSQDQYIRIDIEDGQVYVRLKLESKNYKGIPFQTRREGEHVRINSDGSISFDEYLSKNEYDNEDHLYWTVWCHYVAKYEGGRLKVIEKLMGEGRNSNGDLVKDDKNNPANVKQKTFYNEKDDW